MATNERKDRIAGGVYRTNAAMSSQASPRVPTTPLFTQRAVELSAKGMLHTKAIVSSQGSPRIPPRCIPATPLLSNRATLPSKIRHREVAPSPSAGYTSSKTFGTKRTDANSSHGWSCSASSICLENVRPCMSPRSLERSWRLKSIEERYARARATYSTQEPTYCKSRTRVGDSQETTLSETLLSDRLLQARHVTTVAGEADDDCACALLDSTQEVKQSTFKSVAADAQALKDALLAKTDSRGSSEECVGASRKVSRMYEKSLAAADLIAHYEGVFIGDPREEIEEIYLADWHGHEKMQPSQALQEHDINQIIF